MKILIFYQYFGTPKGGWSTRVYEFTKRWVENGHEVTVVTSPYYKSDIKGKGFISEQNIEGIKLIVINAPDSNKNSFLKRLCNAALFSISSVYFALSFPADVVISSSGPITIAFPGLVAKWLRNRKFVMEVRDLWPRGGIELGKINGEFMKRTSLWFERICYNNSDLVVACSPGMESGIKSVCSECQTLIIPNSSDIQLFDIEKTNPQNFPRDWIDKKVFIYAGSLGLMDDCAQIVRGIAEVQDQDFRFAFIGDGAEKEMLMQLAKSFKIQDEVLFVGLIPKNEVVKWFSIAQASFVTFKDLPVLHTSSPNKMFDSFAAGVPIIQSTKGWIYEMVEKHGCGLNVAPDDPVAFGKAIQQLGGNQIMRESMAKNASQLAKSKFDREILSKKYLSALLNLSQN